MPNNHLTSRKSTERCWCNHKNAPFDGWPYAQCSANYMQSPIIWLVWHDAHEPRPHREQTIKITKKKQLTGMAPEDRTFCRSHRRTSTHTHTPRHMCIVARLLAIVYHTHEWNWLFNCHCSPSFVQLLHFAFCHDRRFCI